MSDDVEEVDLDNWKIPVQGTFFNLLSSVTRQAGKEWSYGEGCGIGP